MSTTFLWLKMDNTLQKSDISKRILETRKQTEELKAQLQNLIETGINSSLELKTTNHSHLDKENIKESENKVQIIKSFDNVHSQHITKPSCSNLNLLEHNGKLKTDVQETNSKKVRNYDVSKAREYIRKQREKRLEQQKVEKEEKLKADIQKQKLQELHKKSLELVTKNVQAKRERSKSRERSDFIRPIKDHPKVRSSSRERGCVNRIRSKSKESTKGGKLVESNINKQSENDNHINPNLLYPPQPNYMLQSQQNDIELSNNDLPLSQKKIIIISGNSSDKKAESPKLETGNEVRTLKPKNLFNTPKSTKTLQSKENKSNTVFSVAQNCNTNDHPTLSKANTRDIQGKDEFNKISRDSFNEIKIIRGNSSDKKVELNESKCNGNRDGDSRHIFNKSDEVDNEKHASVTNIFEYKNMQMKDQNIHLRPFDNTKVPFTNNITLDKPKISELTTEIDNLETFVKKTQTCNESKQQYPPWLQEKRFESNPLNFINSVKRKLQNAINSPKVSVDVGIQSSFIQEDSKFDKSQNVKSKEEIFRNLRHDAKSSKKSDLKSFVSHKHLNLDQKTIENIELIPKKFSGTTTIESYESESESDTSKNIPEISSESGTSMKKNAESVKQNTNVGLDVERLKSLKLRSHAVDKNPHTIHLENSHRKNKFQPNSSIISNKHVNLRSNNAIKDFTGQKSENKGTVSDQYTSDFQSNSESIITYNNSVQTGGALDSTNRNTEHEILTDSNVISNSNVLRFSSKHSNNIPQLTEKHSKNTITSNNWQYSEKDAKNSLKNITTRKNNRKGNISSHSTSKLITELKNENKLEENTVNRNDNGSINEVISSYIVTETEAQSRKEDIESQSSQPFNIRTSKSFEKYTPIDTNSHSSPIEMLSKSDSNLQYINSTRGSEPSSRNTKLGDIPPLKEPTLSLAISNEQIKGKLERKRDRNRLMKNISIRSDRNKFTDLNNTNEIHLKFEAEIHLLNDFNESLRQFSEVEKAFNSLKSKNEIAAMANKVFQNQDTQTSVETKSPIYVEETENNFSDSKSELSTINYSRGVLVEADSSSINLNNSVSKLDDLNSADEFLRLNVNSDLSNFENLQSNNFAGMTLRMFEQLIKDEDVRLENLKTILKIREQALLDRTKGELAWLEIQRKHLRETGKLHEASLIRKKQRGILVNHQKERHEMQRLKQMQKAASTERKIILKEQRNLIKHQLSTEKMLSKIKVNPPRERRLSGPLKVIQSHTESIRSETSFSRRSSSDREKEVHSIMSHTHSIVSVVSEVSGDDVKRKDGSSRTDFTDMAVKLPSEASGVPISQMKRTLLMREAALQKRRKAAEELLQWHRKLLEEEKRITELESTANTIISQIPNNAPASPDVADKYQFKGKQLNQLWFNLTGCAEKKFSENKIYPMSQIALERFCKSAREYSTKTKKLKKFSDSEVSDFSEIKTDDSENIPDKKIIRSAASIRTVSEQSQQSSYKNESVPTSTANDYTSDFDLESLHNIVNIDDMDVVDKNINQLIDNFSKIQDDISSLSIKQSIQTDVDLDAEESLKSDRTESDVDVSVIETAKTSNEKQSQPTESRIKETKTNTSSKIVSLVDIDEFSNKVNIAHEVSDVKTLSDLPVNIQTQESEIKSTEIKSGDSITDKNNTTTTYDKIPSILDESAVSVEGKDNLNKSQEILEELGLIENDISKEESTNEELKIEEYQITNEGKDNLSKSEEILLRLSQSDNNRLSIINSTDTSEKDLLQAEAETNISQSELVQVKLQPIETNVKVSSDTKLPENVTSNRLLSPEIISEVKSSTSVEDIILSAKSSIAEDESLHNEQINSNSEELEVNVENLDLNSEIISEKTFATGAEQVSVESEQVSAIDEVPKTPSTAEDDSVLSKGLEKDVEHRHTEKDSEIPENDSVHVTSSKVSMFEEQADSSQENQNISSVTSKKKNEFLVQSSEGVLETELNENENLSKDESSKSKSKQSLESSSSIKNNDYTEISEQKSKEVSLSKRVSKRVTQDENISRHDSEINTSHGSDISEKNSLANSISEPHDSEFRLSEDEVISSEVSAIEDSNKSQKSNSLATPFSKEDINSYEEKELDSLSSSTTPSRSSILNEKDENSFLEKSKSSSSEDNSSKADAVDVKKRVSEIMADASQMSRGDKSPKLQDFYTTTYDLVSPANSPELGSPTEENKIVAAKSIFGTEAEEILRKQLAIEQEIKQITELQQKEQIPYLFVREIPNKPPPPYTPPSAVPAANIITIIPSSEEIEDITKYSAKILHKAYLLNNLDNISISENTLSLISKNITKECYKFVFDLCKDIAKEHYKQFEKEICPTWLQVRRQPLLAAVKPLDVIGLEKHMNKKLKELFGYEKPVRRENAIIKWSRKKRDHVDEILVMESQTEEAQWTSYDKDELLVMNEVTNEIMNMLLKETGEIFSKILSNQTF